MKTSFLTCSVRGFFAFFMLFLSVPLLALRAPVAHAQILDPKQFQPFVESVRLKYDLPALGAAIVTPQKTYIATAGVRKVGAPDLVTDNDAWHLGSCTKAMTATLAAMLVEEKIVSWETTIGEIFPEMKTMRAEYRAVTLRQLLDQRGGFTDNSLPPGTTYDLWRSRTDSLTAQRLDYVRMMLEQASVYEPGTKMLYSNINFVVAGTMLERLTKKSWEDLMRERLFEPLKMTTAGFGPMATVPSEDESEPKIDGLWAHVWSARREQWRPMLPDKFSDNPQVLGPAGTVHASLGDWAKFIQLQLQANQADTPLLKRETLQELWRGEGEYAAGWRIVNRDWSDGRALYHNGSNLMNYCAAWLSPSREFAVLIATNSYDGRGDGIRQAQACDEIATVAVSQMAHQWELKHPKTLEKSTEKPAAK